MDFSEKYELVGKLLKPGEEARSYSEESSDESDGGAELLEKPDKKDEWAKPGHTVPKCDIVNFILSKTGIIFDLQQTR